MSQQTKRHSDTRMVPVPTNSIVPERDLNSIPVLETRHLSKSYRISGENSLFAKTFRAVSDVSVAVRQGETFGIVGESGCGKSTMARLMMCLEKPDAGEVYLQGRRIDDLPESERRRLRPRCPGKAAAGKRMMSGKRPLRRRCRGRTEGLPRRI